MTDVHTPQIRSKNMRAIRGKNTKFELVVFKGLRKRKIKFKKHLAKLPGSPDIVFLQEKIAVFLDGDFWHGYEYKILGRKPTNGYWEKKIETNIKRDRKVNRELKKMGWRIIRVWEHQIKSGSDKIITKIEKLLINK